MQKRKRKINLYESKLHKVRSTPGTYSTEKLTIVQHQLLMLLNNPLSYLSTRLKADRLLNGIN